MTTSRSAAFQLLPRPPSERSESPWGRPPPAQGLYYNAFFVRATDVSATIFGGTHTPLFPAETDGEVWGLPHPLQAPTLLSPRIRYIYRAVPLFPAALSSSKSLPRAVSIISSLMRFISRFFFGLGQTALFLTPAANLRLHLVVLVDLRENQAKLLLRDLIVGQRGRDPVSD